MQRSKVLQTAGHVRVIWSQRDIKISVIIPMLKISERHHQRGNLVAARAGGFNVAEPCKRFAEDM
jgi:hypothetical protein